MIFTHAIFIKLFVQAFINLLMFSFKELLNLTFFAIEGIKAAIEYSFRESQQSRVISLIIPENSALRRTVDNLFECKSLIQNPKPR